LTVKERVIMMIKNKITSGLIANFTNNITKTNEELTLKVVYLQSTITATERKYKELENVVKSQTRLAERSIISQERRIELKITNLRTSIDNRISILNKSVLELDKKIKELTKKVDLK